MSKNGRRYNIPLFSLFSFLTRQRKQRKQGWLLHFFITLRGFCHSAVGMVAGKNNAAVGGHGGDADGESGAGTLDSYAHNSIKNLSCCKQGI